MQRSDDGVALQPIAVTKRPLQLPAGALSGEAGARRGKAARAAPGRLAMIQEERDVSTWCASINAPSCFGCTCGAALESYWKKREPQDGRHVAPAT